MITTIVLALFGLWIAFMIAYVFADDLLQETKSKLEACQNQLAEKQQALDNLEEEQQDMASGYSTMALMIEELRQQVVNLQKHEDEQDCRLNALDNQTEFSPFVLSLTHIPWSQESADYDDEEPYSESNCPEATPLPNYLNNVEFEGLDTL